MRNNHPGFLCPNIANAGGRKFKVNYKYVFQLQPQNSRKVIFYGVENVENVTAVIFFSATTQHDQNYIYMETVDFYHDFYSTSIKKGSKNDGSTLKSSKSYK